MVTIEPKKTLPRNCLVPVQCRHVGESQRVPHCLCMGFSTLLLMIINFLINFSCRESYYNAH